MKSTMYAKNKQTNKQTKNLLPCFPFLSKIIQSLNHLINNVIYYYYYYLISLSPDPNIQRFAWHYPISFQRHVQNKIYLLFTILIEVIQS